MNPNRRRPPEPSPRLTSKCHLDEILDQLLDQEGLEVDPIDRLEGDTPLHKAVRFINTLSKQEWEAGSSIVDLLLDAGADPRSVKTPSPDLSRSANNKAN